MLLKKYTTDFCKKIHIYLLKLLINLTYLNLWPRSLNIFNDNRRKKIVRTCRKKLNCWECKDSVFQVNKNTEADFENKYIFSKFISVTVICKLLLHIKFVLTNTHTFTIARNLSIDFIWMEMYFIIRYNFDYYFP